MSDTETQAIERATAERFLALYNESLGVDYSVVRVAGPGESPDVECVNSEGSVLWLEVTMTEDNRGDIPALLGRSNLKSVDALRDLLQRVKLGTAKMPVNIIDENVKAVLIQRLQRKFQKRYGTNVALVVRETSIPWDWELILPDVRTAFRCNSIPFDRGVWLLSSGKDRLTHIF